MYESPIEIITKQVIAQQEENLYKAVMETGVIVNKEELIRALAYDRDQYSKGFRDGVVHFSVNSNKEKANLAREIITDLAYNKKLFTLPSWAIEELIKEYTEDLE